MELTATMLADAAVVSQGKLYVHGGQWDRIWAQSFPATHPSLAVVVVVRVEYTEAMKDHHIEAFLELDGTPQGPRVGGQFQTGHAPDSVMGAATFVPMAIPFNAIIFKSPGRYEWVVRVDDEIERRLPMDVTVTKS